MHKHIVIAFALALVFTACSNDSSNNDGSEKSLSGDKKSASKTSSKDRSSSDSASKSGADTSGSVSTGTGSKDNSSGDDEASSDDGADGSNSASGTGQAPAAGTSLIPGLDVSWPAPPEGLATEKVQDAPTFHITRPADLDALNKPMPVVVWANGGCLRSDFSWVPLFNRWAKAGYIVLSLTGMGADGDLFSMLGFTSNVEHKQLIDWVVAQ